MSHHSDERRVTLNFLQTIQSTFIVECRSNQRAFRCYEAPNHRTLHNLLRICNVECICPTSCLLHIPQVEFSNREQVFLYC